MKLITFFAGTVRSTCHCLIVPVVLFFYLSGGVQPCFAKDLVLMLTNENGAPLLTIPVRNGNRFAIRYIHSVAKTPVTDFFIVRDDAIWLDSTVYHDFGAGLPHNTEPGQTMRLHNGELTISGYNRKLQQFTLRVGRIANHTLLIFKDSANENVAEEIRLDSLATPGAAINFVVERTSTPYLAPATRNQ